VKLSASVAKFLKKQIIQTIFISFGMKFGVPLDGNSKGFVIIYADRLDKAIG
jgi:hypothetical protein